VLLQRGEKKKHRATDRVVAPKEAGGEEERTKKGRFAKDELSADRKIRKGISRRSPPPRG